MNLAAGKQAGALMLMHACTDTSQAECVGVGGGGSRCTDGSLAFILD